MFDLLERLKLKILFLVMKKLEHKYLQVLQFENEKKSLLESKVLKLQIDNNNLINRYGIKQPETTRKETELRLKTCDPTTKDIIINYLRLDNFELVKNIA